MLSLFMKMLSPFKPLNPTLSLIDPEPYTLDYMHRRSTRQIIAACAKTNSKYEDPDFPPDSQMLNLVNLRMCTRARACTRLFVCLCGVRSTRSRRTSLGLLFVSESLLIFPSRIRLTTSTCGLDIRANVVTCTCKCRHMYVQMSSRVRANVVTCTCKCRHMYVQMSSHVRAGFKCVQMSSIECSNVVNRMFWPSTVPCSHSLAVCEGCFRCGMFSRLASLLRATVCEGDSLSLPTSLFQMDFQFLRSFWGRNADLETRCVGQTSVGQTSVGQTRP